MRQANADEFLFTKAHQRKKFSGIYMSFYLKIPRTYKRAEQKAHFGLYQSEGQVLAVIIPISYYPPIGSTPPVTQDLIFPHAMMLYIRRKLRRHGIYEVHGAVSEREVDRGTRLYVN